MIMSEQKTIVRKPQSHKKAMARGDELVAKMLNGGESGMVVVTIEVHCGGVRRSGVEQKIVESM